ncbi:hypothetical protein [Glycomyces tenuis]|uniref:hypothetical protein n=1 Tax=Glycomyces tenuis TaxID=58116 RepID=UPI0004264A98|nr:hypothetical protein [Glycomyces tenuis]
MEPNLRAHLCVEHAMASGNLSEADAEAALAAVRPVAEKALGAAPQLLNLADPFEAEVQGAVVFSELLCVPGGEDAISVALFSVLIGRQDDAAASALLRAVEVIASGPAQRYIAAEMERLDQAGVPAPPWEPLLADPVSPVTAWSCSPVLESGGAPHSLMAFEFDRAGAVHGFMVHRDFRGDGSIGKISAIPDIGWRSFRKFLLSGEALEEPYAIEELDWDAAVDHFDEPRAAMREHLRRDPARFAADADLAGVPGLTLLLEAHMAASM